MFAFFLSKLSLETRNADNPKLNSKLEGYSATIRFPNSFNWCTVAQVYMPSFLILASEQDVLLTGPSCLWNKLGHSNHIQTCLFCNFVKSRLLICLLQTAKTTRTATKTVATPSRCFEMCPREKKKSRNPSLQGLERTSQSSILITITHPRILGKFVEL